MAHFKTTAQGSRGEASRLGGKKNGAQCAVQGWHDGVQVYASYNEEHARNEYILRFSGGSSGSKFGTVEIGKVFVKDNEKVVFQPNPRSLNGSDDLILS